MTFLNNPPRYLFLTGKGGVGKTSVACATALQLADSGKSVLLVSTDPASNLDEMIGVKLSNTPTEVPGAARLRAMNIDPEDAAENYRLRVMAQLPPAASDGERRAVREQLSGACTTEIAAFDEFAGLLADRHPQFDHIVFDTAPTGHTIRLLSLPKAWTGFLEGNDRGASCLGPHSGLKMQEQKFRQALAALADPQQTEIMLVTRADRGAMNEAARTSNELKALGLANQRLVINAVFHPAQQGDAIADAIEAFGDRAIAAMPDTLKGLPQYQIAMQPFNMVGVDAIRQLFGSGTKALSSRVASSPPASDLAHFSALVDALAQDGSGLIMVMGKGGVGKTTIAAAIAIGLAQRGHQVHLSTTDPAAHLVNTIEGNVPGLLTDRIDPAVETKRYIDKIMASKGKDLDEQGRALLLEDLASPCTEEVAVFHAFSRIVAEARSSFVVLDTAPTGHTLLLMDAAGAYHRQIVRDAGDQPRVRAITPLMRLQDASYSKIILVTLPETTPISEAAALQEDLRRARIEPFAWVVNRTLIGAHTSDPILSARIISETTQMKRLRAGLARRLYVLPWQWREPVGVAALARMADGHNEQELTASKP